MFAIKTLYLQPKADLECLIAPSQRSCLFDRCKCTQKYSSVSNFE